jgi:hypothetical protein
MAVVGPRSSRRLKTERAVRPGVVVVVDVFVEHAFQVIAIDDQQPVQALAADRADPALGVTVGLGSAVGSPQRRDALVGELWGSKKRHHAATGTRRYALSRPPSRTVRLICPSDGAIGSPREAGGLRFRDRDLKDLSACQLDEEDEEQDVGAREADRVYGEEVTGHHGARLCLKELTPGETGSQPGGWDARAPQEIANRGGGDSTTQPAGLAHDALVAPTRVLAGESKDQVADLGRQGRPYRSPRLATEGGPSPLDKSSVPTDDSFRPDDRFWPGTAVERPSRAARTNRSPALRRGWSTCRWRTRSWCRRTRISTSRSAAEPLRPAATRTSIRTRRQA